jgi:hypothetical protein
MCRIDSISLSLRSICFSSRNQPQGLTTFQWVSPASDGSSTTARISDSTLASYAVEASDLPDETAKKLPRHPSWTATSSSRNHFWRPIADVCARAYARKLRRCDVVSGPIQSHGHPDLATLRRLMTGEHQGDQTGHPPQNRHPPAARGPRRNSLTSSRTQDRRRGGRFICLSSACESVSRGPSKSAGCVNPALPLINFFSLNPQLLQLTVKFRDS